MCGIVGCVGHGRAVEFVTGGLEHLEYRGYDSAGIAYEDEGDSLVVIKKVGSVSLLKPHIPESAELATTAIGHTRWATHGEATDTNAHPQTNEDGSIAVVHNGTIENFSSLKNWLQELGYSFTSETDTEVVPHLIEYFLKEGRSIDEAFTDTIKKLAGAYAILAAYSGEPDTIFAARLGSPLVLGVKGNQYFAASDARVIGQQTRWITRMNDGEVARLSPDNRYSTWHFEGNLTTRPPEELTEGFEVADKGHFEHFMLKEIYEAPQTVRAAISGRIQAESGTVRLGGLEDDPEIGEKLARIKRFVIVGCGTSLHAGLIGERLIEEIAGIPVEVRNAAEFQYSKEPIEPDTAVIGISQSGETADTIGALEKAQNNGMLTLGVNNTPGSRIDRLTDAGVHCRAGLEVSVASTKAFISQVTVMAEIALALKNKKGEKDIQLATELSLLPEKIEQILANAEKIKKVALKYAASNNFLYMGRGYEYISALEGALKLKEISYIHAEGISAGEMKHGTIALIDPNFPTLAIATNGELYEKTVSNVHEIKARKGPVVAIASEGNQEISEIADDVIYVPRTMEQTQPILSAVAMQLFAYYVTREKGLDPDRPRNLAKAVTVE